MAAISTIRNLGPAMEEAFARVGISTAEDLHAMGADAAYRCLLEGGQRPHFIGYYVLHMALQGRPWNDCKGAEKAELRRKFDTLKVETAATVPVGIEAELERLGVGDPSRRRR